MTSTDPILPPRPQASPHPSGIELTSRSASADGVEFQPIECEYLDKDNRKWAEKYVEILRGQLETEQAAPRSDLAVVTYLRRELAAYQELLARPGLDGK